MPRERLAQFADGLLASLLFACSLFFVIAAGAVLSPRFGNAGNPVSLAIVFVGSMGAALLFARTGWKAFTLGVLLAGVFLVATVAANAFASVVLQLFLLALPFGWLRLVDKKRFHDAVAWLKAGRRGLFRNLIVGLLVAVFVLYPLLIVQGMVISALGFGDTAKVSDKVLSLPWWLVFLSFTLVPVSEELFFRAFLLQKLSRFGTVAGVLVSSLIFMLAHYAYGSIGEFAGALTIGLLLSLLFLWRKSVYAPIAAHAAINAASLAVIFLSQYLDAGGRFP